MFTISAIVNGVEYPIHNPKSRRLIVGDPWFEVGDNINGSAEFTVYPEHPFFDRVHKLTTEIVIRNDGVEEFRGRVLYDDEDFSGSKKVVCEGELAYLCDSIQRPKVYHNTSVKDYVADLLANHNRQVEARKQFQLGIVTVVDSNDSLYRYSNWNSTRECLSDKLVDRLGGHLVVRWSNGVRYLDYLSDNEYYHAANQKIEFGRNLLDFAKNADATDLATCIIPLGAKQEEEDAEGEEISTDSNLDNRLTIESVNNGVDYVFDSAAVQEYGKIYKTIVNDDITTASYLKSWGEEYLQSSQFETLVLEVNAIDLGLQDSRVQRFMLGHRIHCISKPNGMDVWLPVSTMKINIQRAVESTLTLGTSSAIRTFTSSSQSTTSALKKSIDDLPTKAEIVQDAVDQSQDLFTTALEQAQALYNSQLQNGYAHYLENELVISDNATLSESTKMWRWGLGGLAYSNDGYNGSFKTAWTMDGAFVADFITAGTLRANIIKAGILSDEAGVNYWNMETGEFRLSAAATVGGKTVDEIATDAVGDLDDSLTQSDIFNRLTNNGQTQGIYLSEGKLYINADYLKTGILSDGAGKNFWNLNTGEFRLSANSTVGGKSIATADTAITDVDVEYRLSDSATSLTGNYSWSTTAPAWVDGKYMWQRTATTANGTTSYSDPTCISGATGASGSSIAVSSVLWASGTSGTQAPSSGWQSSVPSVQKGKWLWCKVTYSDGSVATTCSYMGTDGKDGKSVAIQSITKTGKNTSIVLASSDGTTQTITISDGEDGTNGTPGINGYIHIAWATSADGSQGFSTSISAGKTYLGVYTDDIEADSNSYSDYSWSLIKGAKGDDGVGISATTIKYGISSSASTQPSSWQTSVPTVEQGKWLWVQTQYSYTDGTSKTVYSKSYAGTDGEDGASVVIQSSSKTGDTTTVVLACTDGTTQTLTIKDGEDGTNGTPGSSGYVHIAWATSADGSQGFSTSVSSGKTYIGVYTDNTEADSNNPAAYSWSLIKGETGTGVSAVVEQYYLSTSSTAQSGGSWSTAQPQWVKNKYIWTRTAVTWTDGTTTYTSPVLAKAINGANEAVEDLDAELNQQEIFNRLTNNGQTQGIYLSGGKLYVNADYIKSGKITSDYINVGTLSAISGNVGTLTAGVIKSSNYSSGSAGMQLDLTNGTADIRSGKIGGWSISENKIYYDGGIGSRVAMQAASSTQTYAFAAGSSSNDSYADAGFRVTKTGNLFVGVAHTGTLTAGTATTDNDTFSGSTVPLRVTSSGVYIYGSEINPVIRSYSNTNFSVPADGTGISISGISSSALAIAGYQISGTGSSFMNITTLKISGTNVQIYLRPFDGTARSGLSITVDILCRS